MILENMKKMNLSDFKRIVKVGDTVSDIREGKSVGCWTIGILEGSNLLGLS